LQIKITGLASKKSTLFDVSSNEMNLNLLEFLRSKDMPVASSCDGVALCHKCVTSQKELSCRIYLKDLNDGEEISFDYL